MSSSWERRWNSFFQPSICGPLDTTTETEAAASTAFSMASSPVVAAPYNYGLLLQQLFSASTPAAFACH